MYFLRNSKLFASFALVWFVLFLGTAVASSIVSPGNMQLVCCVRQCMRLRLQRRPITKNLLVWRMLCNPLQRLILRLLPPRRCLRGDPQPLSFNHTGA
jgi:hypothetical protein